MNNTLKTVLLAAVVGLASISAAARSGIPHEIYQPRGELIKSDRQGNGEWEVEYRLKGDDVRPIAKAAVRHAEKQGFRVVESEIKRDNADLKFRRGDQELDVDIELKNHGRIEYKADLDLDKN